MNRNMEVISIPDLKIGLNYISQASRSTIRVASPNEISENFKKIYAAIKQYETDKEKLPDWLSDLIPDYLSNEVLFCPLDTEHKAEYSPDPNLPCSYSWEFSTKPVPADWDDPSGKMLYRDWKILQVKKFGDIAPTVRCHHHDNHCLNLAFGGKIYWSSLVWEFLFDPDYSFSLEELRKDK